MHSFGYFTLCVFGFQRCQWYPDATKHIKVIRLLAAAIEDEEERKRIINLGDVANITAMQHSLQDQNPAVPCAKVLLQLGADVNHQDRYGSTAMHGNCMSGNLEALECLLEAGASIDILEADGITVRKMRMSCGPAIVQKIQHHMNKRDGIEKEKLKEKTCDVCNKDTNLRLCSRCKVGQTLLLQSPLADTLRRWLGIALVEFHSYVPHVADRLH